MDAHLHSVMDFSKQSELFDSAYTEHGFLPVDDPLTHFPADSDLALLDHVGSDLPNLLLESHFRQYVRELVVPLWPDKTMTAVNLPALRLYYLRLAFIASAYVNQVGQKPITLLPSNIAVPLCHVCQQLQRPPILSYDAYALYNWKRQQQNKGIVLGNIDTIQNFVNLYDEHWFILIHVEIEAIAARILEGIVAAEVALTNKDETILNTSLQLIADALQDQIRVLRRIPEHMDPMFYYKTFRPYIRFFEHIVYEGLISKRLIFAVRPVRKVASSLPLSPL